MRMASGQRPAAARESGVCPGQGVFDVDWNEERVAPAIEYLKPLSRGFVVEGAVDTH